MGGSIGYAHCLSVSLGYLGMEENWGYGAPLVNLCRRYHPFQGHEPPTGRVPILLGGTRTQKK